MDKVIARIDFVLNGKKYIAGDKIEIKDIDVIRRLNEEGFIEPLSYRELVILERKLEEL